MSGLPPGAAPSGGPPVRLVSPHTGLPVRRVTATRTQSGRRVTAWIVRSIMAATTVFAFLDLVLLASGGHH